MKKTIYGWSQTLTNSLWVGNSTNQGILLSVLGKHRTDKLEDNSKLPKSRHYWPL